MTKLKRPRDTNQLAKMITDMATGDSEKDGATEETPAQQLGRLGGLKGGKARSEKLTSQQRSEIAKKAANKRWNKS